MYFVVSVPSRNLSSAKTSSIGSRSFKTGGIISFSLASSMAFLVALKKISLILQLKNPCYWKSNKQF